MAAPGSLKGTLESCELQLGDLCVYTVDDKLSQLKNHVIYQVVKKDALESTSYANHRYAFRAAFDVTSPVGDSIDSFVVLGTRGLRRLTLLDLCTIRLHLDDFIRQYARECGAESDSDRSQDGQPSTALATP